MILVQLAFCRDSWVLFEYQISLCLAFTLQRVGLLFARGQAPRLSLSWCCCWSGIALCLWPSKQQLWSPPIYQQPPHAELDETAPSALSSFMTKTLLSPVPSPVSATCISSQQFGLLGCLQVIQAMSKRQIKSKGEVVSAECHGSKSYFWEACFHYSHYTEQPHSVTLWSLVLFPVYFFTCCLLDKVHTCVFKNK